MEGNDINMTSQAEGRGQQGSHATDSLRIDGGSTPDTQTQASPFNQPLSDEKPLAPPPATDQVRSFCDHLPFFVQKNQTKRGLLTLVFFQP